MDHLKTYKDLLDEIGSLIGKLESSSLTMEELFELENATRKIHERSIILRYKAFENKLADSASTEDKVEEIKADPEKEEPVVEEIVEEEPIEEEAIDFSMFDDSGSDEEGEENIEQKEEAIDFAPIDEEQENEQIEEESEVQESATTASKDETTSFIDKFMTEDNSLSSKFAGSKLDSLVGAFGLNEKLRYINDLFDGSSDHFSDAIKMLDAKNSMTEATDYISELANKHDWDYEEEIVLEFMVYVKRRYA